MAERARSNDGSRDTDKVLGDKGKVSQQGRTDGNLQRDVATQDEKKRAKERPAGTSRVTGQDKRNHGESA